MRLIIVLPEITLVSAVVAEFLPKLVTLVSLKQEIISTFKFERNFCLLKNTDTYKFLHNEQLV